MTVERAIEFLSGLADYERALPRSYDKATFGIERMRHLCDRLGRPQDAYRTIQVGGTNGKGSVCAFAESILRHAGLRTGMTTSPHLLSLRERIRICGRIADDEPFASSVAAVADAVSQLPEDERTTVTFFEAITAAAFEAFRWSGVEVAVVEVGLGGRFDATSVIAPDVLVITPIGHDHAAFLGDTIEAIAADKSHLIRGPAPVVLGCAEPALGIFRARAREFAAPVYILGEDLQPWTGPLGLSGDFQRANAACAAKAVELLMPGIRAEAVAAGLCDARWPGRLQVIAGQPTIVLDAAMNLEAAQALGRELTRLFGGGAIALVVGMSHDKDATAFMKGLVTECPNVAHVLACAAANPRAMAADRLAAALLPVGISAVVAPSVAAALETARSLGTDVVCVTGSVYTVGEALAALGLGPEV